MCERNSYNNTNISKELGILLYYDYICINYHISKSKQRIYIQHGNYVVDKYIHEVKQKRYAKRKLIYIWRQIERKYTSLLRDALGKIYTKRSNICMQLDIIQAMAMCIMIQTSFYRNINYFNVTNKVNN